MQEVLHRRLSGSKFQIEELVFEVLELLRVHGE